MARFLLVSAFLAFGTAACALFDSGYDTKQLPDGRFVDLDTPRMWERWKWSVDTEVRREVLARSGKTQDDPLHGTPQGGGTWNEYWMSRILAVQKAGRENTQENAERYVAYIRDQRREAGLPELAPAGG